MSFKTKFRIIVGSAIVMVPVLYWAYTDGLRTNIHVEVPVAEAAEVCGSSCQELAKELMGQKVDVLKDEVVNSIAGCETKGVAEPDAAIILDTNNEMSIGSLMYQIKTVQHYVKKFEAREITRKEAIETAIDHTKAHNLAKRIIFEEKGGQGNWYNCSQRLGIDARVAAINEIAK